MSLQDNYVTALFTTSVILFILAIFVYLKGRHKTVNATFSLYSLCIAIWSLGQAYHNSATDRLMAIFWARYFHAGVIFISTSFVYFTLALLGEDLLRRKLIRTLYTVSFIFLLFDFMPLFIPDAIPKYSLNYYWIIGPVYSFFLIFWFGSVAYALHKLYVAYHSVLGMRRNQLKLLFWATLFAYLGGSSNYLPAFNIHLYPFNPFGTYAVPIYGIIVAYLILRHRLMDIEVVIKKTLVYSIVISVITALYFSLIYFIERTFSQIVGYKSVPIAIGTIAFFSITFIPLKNYIQCIVDKYFFHGSIAEINAENIKLRYEIEKTEKLKAIATLAAGMAHEIKNPLTGIKTFAEYLPQKHNDPAFMQKFQKIVGMEVDKINNIVKQLLEFAKPSELDIKSINISDLLNETSDLLNSDFLRSNIKLVKNYTPFPKIQIDPVQMKQVFLNLLLNAKDSMPEGGAIRIRTGKNRSGQVSIKIIDTGRGISKEDLKHIFDPFFTKKAVGTGLGLNVVHGIITKHNGSINVESTIGKGTIVEISLPHPSFTS